MAKKTGKNTGKGGALGPEDFQLWKEFTRDIEPLEEPDWAAMAPAEDTASQQKPAAYSAGETIAPLVPVKAKKIPGGEQAAQLDARTEARLRRGQMPVEGRLDLHGMTQEQAHTRLNDFIVRAHTQGKRCVLVITGKGLSKGRDDDRTIGVLRQKLPLWLSMMPLRAIVLKSYSAVQRDGGTGAWYIYLRRERGY